MTERYIYVTKNQEIQGPYTPEEIQTRLMSGHFLSSDLAWHQGVSEWKALFELFPSTPIRKPQRISLVRRKFSGFARASYFIGLFGIFLWLIVFLPLTLLSGTENTEPTIVQQGLRVFKYACMLTNTFGVSLAFLALLNKYSSKTKAIYGLIFNSILLVMYWVLLKH